MTHSTVRNELESGRRVTYHTLGSSMRPLLIERETHVVIRPYDRAERLDILLYVRENGMQVLHRMINEDESFFYMRGDNTFGREKISKKQAIGIVDTIYRRGRSINVKTDLRYRLYVRMRLIDYPFRFALRILKKSVRRLFK